MENAGKVFTANRELYSPTAQSTITEEDRVRQVIDRSSNSRQIKNTHIPLKPAHLILFSVPAQVIFALEAQALLKPVQKDPSAVERDRPAAACVPRGRYTYTYTRMFNI